MTKDLVSEVLEKHGAFWAFSDKQFNEQKKDGVRYVSCGAGLIAPKDNIDNFTKELDKAIKETKRIEKERIEARAKVLKIEKLSKDERILNRKILIKDAISRINNYMDDCYVAEHYRMIDNAQNTQKSISRVINSVLNAISWRYHERADYEADIKEVYDDNIATIKELTNEIQEIINNK